MDFTSMFQPLTVELGEAFSLHKQQHNRLHALEQHSSTIKVLINKFLVVYAKYRVQINVSLEQPFRPQNMYDIMPRNQPPLQEKWLACGRCRKAPIQTPSSGTELQNISLKIKTIPALGR
jgi:hypothetical protein